MISLLKLFGYHLMVIHKDFRTQASQYHLYQELLIKCFIHEIFRFTSHRHSTIRVRGDRAESAYIQIF